MMIRIASRRFAAPAVIALILSVAGCGDGAPPVDSSRAEGTVKGVVTIRGKPATKGRISFDASNIKRKDVAPISADLGPDGSYTVKTLVGINQVTFSGPAFTKEQEVQDANFQFDVKQGENTFNPDLPPGTTP